MELWVLERALEENFESSDLRQGLFLYQKNAVTNLKISTDQITASVKNGYAKYKVEFDYDELEYEEYIEFDGECTCPEKFYCPHQAAVIYQTIEKLKKGAAKIQSLPHQLKGTHAGEFRELPIDAGLQNAIEKYGPRRYNRLSWNEQFQGDFISKSEIKLEAVSSYNHHYGHPKAMLIKMEKEKVFVKCLTCNDETKILCKHQMPLLEAASDILQQYFNGLPDSYDTALVNIAQQLNISTETVDKYFKMRLLPKGIGFVPKENNMVDEEWLKEVKGLGNQSKTDKKLFIETTTEQLTEGREQKYAFFWTVDDDRRAVTGRLKLYFQK